VFIAPPDPVLRALMYGVIFHFRFAALSAL
jgi:hypothetical protein